MSGVEAQARGILVDEWRKAGYSDEIIATASADMTPENNLALRAIMRALLTTPDPAA